MNVLTRIERLERHLRRPVRHGWVYTLQDGTQRTLSYKAALKGFSDCTNHIVSNESFIIQNAINDSNGGAMLRLLAAVLNPVNTDI